MITQYPRVFVPLILLFAAVAVFGFVYSAHAQVTTTSSTTIDTNMLIAAHTPIDLTVGSVSPNVQTLEIFLQNRGYFPANLIPDQSFDLVTQNALAAYQLQAHVLNTGYYGPMTRAHMIVVLWHKLHGWIVPVQ